MIHPFLNYIHQAFSGISPKVWLLSFVSFINRSGAMVICFLTLYLTDHLHFSLTDAGYMMAWYGAGSILGAYLGGRWTDKYGFQPIQLGTLLFSGVTLLVLMFQTSFWSISFWLFLFNLSSEAFRPANQVAIRMNSDEANRTRAFSLMRVAVNLAITFALIIGGFLIGLGWHWIFLGDSLTCFLAAALIFYYIPSAKMPSTQEQKERNIVQKNELQATKPSNNTPPVSAYNDPHYILFVALTFFNAMIFMQILWTVPKFFKQIYTWNESHIGLISSLNGAIVMGVEMLLIFKIEGKRSNLWFIRLGVLCYAVAYLAFLIPTSFAFFAALLYMIFISFGEMFVMPFSSSWVTKRAPEATLGQYLALYTMAYSVSNVVAPIFGTQIIEHFGFFTLWCALVIMSIGTWFGFRYLEKEIFLRGNF
jgi:predicted MFS family arabinose efflux permease